MFNVLTTTLVGLVAATGASAASKPECVNGLYMIIARGTGDFTKAGDAPNWSAFSGATGYVGSQVAAQIKDSKVVGVDYPATFSSLENYIESENAGAKTMLKLANEYAEACPNNKMALVGYSQGAHVATDTLCGGAGGEAGDAPGLSAAIIKKNVIAGLFIADPTHVANISYDRGTSKHDGFFPRETIKKCLPYANIVESWCDTNDKYCDNGTSLEIHQTYIERHNATFIEYLVSRWKDTEESTKSTTPSATTTPSSPSGTSTGKSDHPGAAGSVGAAQGFILGSFMLILTLALS